MKRLAILGASGHGKVVADTAECCGWEKVDFFDDDWPRLQVNGHWRVSGDCNALISRLSEFDGVLVAIGSNDIRHTKLIALRNAGAPLATLIHPSATISRYAVIGEGTVVFAGVVVNAYARIGLGVILNTGCCIEHDCVLGHAVHISPGARLAGGVQMGDFSWVGIGACVRQLICIGSNVTVGAGAVVVADIANGTTVVGVPAKTMRH